MNTEDIYSKEANHNALCALERDNSSLEYHP